ncbi:MAG: rod shape-determining protein MreC [Ruminococcus sp.]|jgi:rod shape-determining protein MreC|nr:rod shape-determining protein MreC [Ruminococcus sp.]
MKDFFHSLKFKALIGLTAVILGVMVFIVFNEGITPDSGALFTRITAPFSKISADIESGFSDFLSTFINAEKNKVENEALKTQLDALYNQMSDYEDLKRENAELSALLSLQERNENITFSRPSDVIARTVGDPYLSFTIDSGRDDGISPYDPAVTENGLVGIVASVTKTTSTIQTLYSPKSAVSVISSRTLVRGIIEGETELISDGLVRMNYIDKTADIVVGDVVETEGSEMFPPGQIIGVVTAVAIEDNGLAKYAEVRLLVDPSKVSSLYIITDFNGKAIENEEQG